MACRPQGGRMATGEAAGCRKALACEPLMLPQCFEITLKSDSEGHRVKVVGQGRAALSGAGSSFIRN